MNNMYTKSAFRIHENVDMYRRMTFLIYVEM